MANQEDKDIALAQVDEASNLLLEKVTEHAGQQSSAQQEQQDEPINDEELQ